MSFAAWGVWSLARTLGAAMDHGVHMGLTGKQALGFRAHPIVSTAEPKIQSLGDMCHSDLSSDIVLTT